MKFRSYYLLCGDYSRSWYNHYHWIFYDNTLGKGVYRKVSREYVRYHRLGG